MSDLSFQPVRGTRDLYPEDHRFREWLFGHFRTIGKRFGFEEVDAPVLEHADLLIRKAGEEIVDQLYHFELHDRHLALRPEMTPSIARMIIARAGGLRMPVRWFTVTQNWRYERMTRGRKREHYQWNMDVWGVPGVAAEAELIAAAVALFDAVGLARGDVLFRVNSRALLEETLRGGVLREHPERFEPLCVVIDKIAKIGADAVVAQLVDPAGPVAIDAEAAGRVVDILAAESLGAAAAHAPDDSAAVADLRQLFTLLEAYGVAEQVVFDASVVRGLAYYTGIVFEAFDAGATLRSLCGGGRYDRLSESLGGPPIPAVGFGLGDVVIAELLADKGLVPELARPLDEFVFAQSADQHAAAIAVAARLRAIGRRVELALVPRGRNRALKDAARIGAARVWEAGLGDDGSRVATLAAGRPPRELSLDEVERVAVELT